MSKNSKKRGKTRSTNPPENIGKKLMDTAYKKEIETLSTQLNAAYGILTFLFLEHGQQVRKMVGENVQLLLKLKTKHHDDPDMVRNINAKLRVYNQVILMGKNIEKDFEALQFDYADYLKEQEHGDGTPES